MRVFCSTCCLILRRFHLQKHVDFSHHLTTSDNTYCTTIYNLQDLQHHKRQQLTSPRCRDFIRQSSLLMRGLANGGLTTWTEGTYLGVCRTKSGLGTSFSVVFWDIFSKSARSQLATTWICMGPDFSKVEFQATLRLHPRAQATKRRISPFLPPLPTRNPPGSKP